MPLLDRDDLVYMLPHGIDVIRHNHSAAQTLHPRNHVEVPVVGWRLGPCAGGEEQCRGAEEGLPGSPFGNHASSDEPLTHPAG